MPIIGTPVESIEEASDREKFHALIKRLNLRQPSGAIAMGADDALEAAKEVGYPVLVRPSFVLGGRAMEVCYDETELKHCVALAVEAAEGNPILIDQFLDSAIEVDVDCVSDGEEVVLAGIMEHIEYAGVHSGDSMCSIPAQTLSEHVLREIRDAQARPCPEGQGADERAVRRQGRQGLGHRG